MRQHYIFHSVDFEELKWLKIILYPLSLFFSLNLLSGYDTIHSYLIFTQKLWISEKHLEIRWYLGKNIRNLYFSLLLTLSLPLPLFPYLCSPSPSSQPRSYVSIEIQIRTLLLFSICIWIRISDNDRTLHFDLDPQN